MARFFVDETDLALGKRLGAAYEGVVFPGHAEFPEVPRGSFDDEWLPVVGEMRLVVITRDKRIRYRPGEKQHRLQSNQTNIRRRQRRARALRPDRADSQ